MNFVFYNLLIAIAIYLFAYFIGYRLGRIDGQNDIVKKINDKLKSEVAK